MKIVVNSYELGDEYETRHGFEIQAVSDKTEEVLASASFLDGEPEDSNLSRDFNDVYNIENLMLLAYEAGKAGEELTVKIIHEEPV